MLIDLFNRRFSYLRLSVTDVCNFRCQYCLPNGYQKNHRNFLNILEIQRLIKAFSALGITKVRLTGGEPATRQDLCEVIAVIKNTPGIHTVALSTNGYNLDHKLSAYISAGIQRFNISLDSLQADRFSNITQNTNHRQIMESIQRIALDTPAEVKVNTVLLRGINDDEIEDFIQYSQLLNISVRFIELMETLDSRQYFQDHHISSAVIRNKLIEGGWHVQARETNSGPAEIYQHPNQPGNIGIIAPYSKDFCQGCNRLRVTARGELQLCLFGQQRTSLRHLLQEDSQQEELKQTILTLLYGKTAEHALVLGDCGITHNLAATGG